VRRDARRPVWIVEVQDFIVSPRYLVPYFGSFAQLSDIVEMMQIKTASMGALPDKGLDFPVTAVKAIGQELRIRNDPARWKSRD
jgi:hypothetical protein